MSKGKVKDDQEKAAEIDKIIRRFGDNLLANRPLQDGLADADPLNLEAAHVAAGSILVGFDVLNKLDRSVQHKVLFAGVLADHAPEEAAQSYNMFLMHEVVEGLAVMAKRKS